VLAMMLDHLADNELEGFLVGARALHRARDRFHEQLPQSASEAAR
jgi:hypothetical protein